MTTSPIAKDDAPGVITWLIGLAVASTLWFAIYGHLTEFADAVIAALGLAHGTAIGEAVHFFFYDTPKVLLLLTGIVFLMGIIQTLSLIHISEPTRPY